jgi:hypothetical protein
MKNDKFLLGIVTGIVLLVVVAVIVVLTRGQREDYQADDTPAGVTHNYFLALQRKEYERAYSYLSDELENKPELDEFIQTLDYSRSEAALQVGETTITGRTARVETIITTYTGGGPLSSGSYTNRETAFLAQNAAGEWKITQFSYPYWGWDWDQTWAK